MRRLRGFRSDGSGGLAAAKIARAASCGIASIRGIGLAGRPLDLVCVSSLFMPIPSNHSNRTITRFSSPCQRVDCLLIVFLVGGEMFPIGLIAFRGVGIGVSCSCTFHSVDDVPTSAASEFGNLAPKGLHLLDYDNLSETFVQYF